jgi:hypothetical protein
MVVSDCNDLMWTAATAWAWASLVALGIVWEARMKFMNLLRAPGPDDLDMSLSRSNEVIAGNALDD